MNNLQIETYARFRQAFGYDSPAAHEVYPRLTIIDQLRAYGMRLKDALLVCALLSAADAKRFDAQGALDLLKQLEEE